MDLTLTVNYECVPKHKRTLVCVRYATFVYGRYYQKHRVLDKKILPLITTGLEKFQMQERVFRRVKEGSGKYKTCY